MQSKVYSVYDVKALSYGPPFLASTDGIAIRMFGELVNDPNTSVGRHPEDFKLYAIGFFEDQRGTIKGTSPPEHVVDAVALVPFQKRLPVSDTTEVA